MKNTKNYWNNKEERAERALRHTEEMDARYPKEIAACIESSIVYGLPDKVPKKTETGNVPKTYFLNTDSVTALMMSRSKKKAVLNFASYKNPGGMFVRGSSAQEESLCHESFLYNILKEMPEYYAWNNEHKNNAMYMNRAIYTPEVIFERDEAKTKCDVITCAAPNKSAAQKYRGVSNAENFGILKSRIGFIRKIAEENNVETLILGAFGCGVFGQDPEDVCKLMQEEFKNSTVKSLVFAVPGNGNDKNVKVFREAFAGEKEYEPK